jgi:trigger factor
MQVSVEKIDDFGRRLKVVLPRERFTDGIHARIRELSKTVRLQGFRQGKVPPMIIEQRFGQQLRDEVMQELVRESLSAAVVQEKLRPALSPRVTPPSNDGDFSFEATFDVLPDFDAIDVSDLEIERETAEVADADIDRMIDTLRRQRMSFRPVERAAQAGDYVAFEFVIAGDGIRIPAEGKERGLTAIGQKAVLPEIEEALVGLAPGDEKTVEATFPADYREAALAGKTASITVTVTRVNEGVMPEVDEAFAASFNVPGGVEAFRREVRGNLERELKQNLSMRLRASVVERLLARFEGTKVPESLVTEEAHALQRQAIAENTERARRMNQPVPPEPAVESLREIARRRVTAGLLLQEIAQQQNLRLDENRVRAALSAIASTYEDPTEVVQMYQQDQRLMQSLRSRVMDEQVAEWIADHAKTTRVERSFQELLQPSLTA